MSLSEEWSAIQARERTEAFRAAGLCPCGRVEAPAGELCADCRERNRRRANRGRNRCSRCRELGHTLPICPLSPLDACRRALAQIGREVVSGYAIARAMGATDVSPQVRPCIEAARETGLLVVHRVRAVRGQPERVWYRVTERNLFVDGERMATKDRSGELSGPNALTG